MQKYMNRKRNNNKIINICNWKILKKVKVDNKEENIECGVFENCISLKRN